MIRRRNLRILVAALTATFVVTSAGAQATLGPVDGAGLTATDTGRVRAGMMAPDFTLESFGGGPVTLSGFRGSKTILLAFYRGHW